MSYRKEILEWAANRYGTEPEYLWAVAPNYAVLRHSNGKWYAAILDVPRKKLGLPGDDIVDILDIQCDPILSGSLRQQPGILPGYHMNKEKWISILLDGTVEWEQILVLLEMSYDITAKKQQARKKKPGRKAASPSEFI